MIKKRYLKTRRACKVTFTLPEDVQASNANIVGDFNYWDLSATPMQRKQGNFKVTLELKLGKSYHFRYLVDGKEWITDSKADRLWFNTSGSYNSVVCI